MNTSQQLEVDMPAGLVSNTSESGDLVAEAWES